MLFLRLVFQFLLILLTVGSLKVSAQNSCIDIFKSERGKISSLLDQPYFYNRGDYLRALSEHVKTMASPEIYKAGGVMNHRIDSNGKALKLGYNLKHPNLDKVLAVLTQYPENFMDLLVDRGVLNHADAFLNFLAQCPNCKNLDRWEVRRRASEFIGKTTVYRAVYITAATARKIKKNGFIPRSLVEFDHSEYRAKKIIHNFTSHFDSQISKHQSNTSDSALISVSSYPEVAIAVAQKYAEEIAGEGSVYLFKIEIPILDLIHESHYDESDYLVEREMTRELYGFHMVDQSGQQTVYASGPDLESLILFRVLPYEIKNVVEVKEVVYRALTKH